MKFTSLIPMLRTGNMKESIDFYVNILGFICENYSDEWGWASLTKDNVTIMLSKDKARLCYPVENFEYGMREFAVYDNNG
jgi:hypothetical protein